MSPTHSAEPGASRTGPTTTPSLVRATSPAKSRLTVRLPDLSAPRRTTDLASTAAEPDAKEPFGPTSGVAAAVNPPASSGARGGHSARLRERLPSLEALPRKVLAFVRQPQFWLACVVAIAVQVVLAVVMTPAEGDSVRPERTAAKPWPKSAPAPAVRIIVPSAPAPTDVPEQADVPLHGTTTPMGLTVPWESSSDSAAPVVEGPTDADSVNLRLPRTRTADRRRWADHAAGQLDGGAGGETDGATLDGILPMEPNPKSITTEKR